MFDLVPFLMESLKLIIPENDETEAVYISGGFARNDIFVTLIAAGIKGKDVYTSEIENATALGAAMVITDQVFGKNGRHINLGLKKINRNQ
jgi:sugar (pentulose or hexulose) kinase